MVATNSHTCPEADNREIYALFRNASQGNIRVFKLFHALSHDLSLTKIRALMYLEQHLSGTRSIGELAKELASSLGWASRIACELSMEGLIDCIRDRRDRRLVHVKLTEKGIRTARLLSANLQRPVVDALSEVPPEQRTLISQFLQQFTIELNRQAAEMSIPRQNSARL
jgi:DNA-binding MarR family transcriptional regulator